MTSLNVQKIGENKTSFIEVEKAKGVYLNSNYIETGDKKQLIQCSKNKWIYPIYLSIPFNKYYSIFLFVPFLFIRMMTYKILSL